MILAQEQAGVAPHASVGDADRRRARGGARRGGRPAGRGLRAGLAGLARRPRSRGLPRHRPRRAAAAGAPLGGRGNRRAFAQPRRPGGTVSPHVRLRLYNGVRHDRRSPPRGGFTTAIWRSAASSRKVPGRSPPARATRRTTWPRCAGSSPHWRTARSSPLSSPCLRVRPRSASATMPNSGCSRGSFGIPQAALPQGWPECAGYVERMPGLDVLAVGNAARTIADALTRPAPGSPAARTRPSRRVC